MIRKVLGNENVGAAAVLALSGVISVLACKREGPLSPGRVVSGVLSNPIPVGRVGDDGSSIPTLSGRAA
ncbi:MAG TPA: hypothetical protein VKA73_07340 [Rubrobacter sp.]|nr:hypothetical protein [Rubrobacter sp.]